MPGSKFFMTGSKRYVDSRSQNVRSLNTFCKSSRQVNEDASGILLYHQNRNKTCAKRLCAGKFAYIPHLLLCRCFDQNLPCLLVILTAPAHTTRSFHIGGACVRAVISHAPVIIHCPFPSRQQWWILFAKFRKI